MPVTVYIELFNSAKQRENKRIKEPNVFFRNSGYILFFNLVAMQVTDIASKKDRFKLSHWNRYNRV